MPDANILQGNCPPGTIPIQIGGQTFCVPRPQTSIVLQNGVLNISISGPHGQQIAEEAAKVGIQVDGLVK